MCTIYENIERLCRKNSITGGKMCTDLNLSRSILTGLKNGKKKTINSATANKIANYFNVSVDEILLPHIEPDITTLFAGPGEFVPSRSTPTPDIRAAFFEGADDLTEEELDELWEDARDYIQFKIKQKKEKK